MFQFFQNPIVASNIGAYIFLLQFLQITTYFNGIAETEKKTFWEKFAVFNTFHKNNLFYLPNYCQQLLIAFLQ